MGTLTHTATVDASKTDTWNVLKDFSGIHKWHFNIESSPLTSENNEGLGATRVCTFYDGTELTERVVEYADEESMNVAFVEHSMPMKRANVVFTVKELASDKTEVTVHMDYDMKFGPVGWMIDKMMISPIMSKVFVRMLDGLNHHTTTGEIIGKDGEIVAAAS